MTDHPCLEVPFDVVTKWEKIEGSCARLYAAAEWGYKQALATAPPTDDDLIEIARELRKTAEYLQLGCGWNKALRAIESAANLIEGDLLQRLVPPPEPPTDEELVTFLYVIDPEDELSPLAMARAVIERWGHG